MDPSRQLTEDHDQLALHAQRRPTQVRIYKATVYAVKDLVVDGSILKLGGGGAAPSIS